MSKGYFIQRSLSILGLFLVFMAILGFAFSSAPNTAIRSMPNTYTPGVPVTVSIAYTPITDTIVWAAIEYFPQGWTASNAGCIIPSTGEVCASTEYVILQDHVEWVFVMSDTTSPRVLTYTITPQANDSGTKSFSGSILDYFGTIGYLESTIKGKTVIEQKDAKKPKPAVMDKKTINTTAKELVLSKVINKKQKK